MAFWERTAQVTMKDLRRARRWDCRSCPVAEALSRDHPTGARPHVRVYYGPDPEDDSAETEYALIENMLPAQQAVLPRWVWKRIEAYDHTGRMAPFTFPYVLENI